MNIARVCDFSIKGAEEKEEVLFYKDMSNHYLVSFQLFWYFEVFAKKGI